MISPVMDASLRGKLLRNETLASYTSWHVGGPAKQLYMPADLLDLACFLQTLPSDELIVWLGLGSNLLIRDGGIDGTVIRTQGTISSITALENNIIRAEAGTTCAKLAKFCARQKLSGGSFFAGIPGTVGGALAMNAGAFGHETWSYVTAVETIDRAGNIRHRRPEDFEVSYRHVKGAQEEWFVAGQFQFFPGDEEKAHQEIRELLHKRGEAQPIGEFSCGSVFRNPPGDYAGRLIESCGLKGRQKGGAWVSPKHGNFIINKGEATAADIENLIFEVRDIVKEKTGIELVPECHIKGEV